MITTASLSGEPGEVQASTGSRPRSTRQSLRWPIVLALLIVTGSSVATTAPSWASDVSPSPAQAFASRILKEAWLPSSAVLAKSSYKGLGVEVGAPAIIGLVDQRRVFLLRNDKTQVIDSLRKLAPADTRVSSSGRGADGTTEFVVFTLPVQGPHEYLSQLAYNVVSIGPHMTAMRVDAEVVWVPNRPAEEIPSTVTSGAVTGYAHVSLSGGASGGTTIVLTRAAALRLTAVIAALPPGPTFECFADAPIYKIQLFSGGQSTLLVGHICGRTVTVTASGRNLPSLYDARCSVLSAVDSLLFSRGSVGTGTLRTRLCS